MDCAESDASDSQEVDSQRAYTWVFRATVHGNLVGSSQFSTIKSLLDSRKGRQEECLAVADTETITCTCSELLGTEPRTTSVKSFVRGHTKIGECSLKQWLAMDHMPELKAIEFEAVNPGRNQRDRRYRNHPAIKTFLDATSLEPTVDGRPLRVDYYGSSEANERANRKAVNHPRISENLGGLALHEFLREEMHWPRSDQASTWISFPPETFLCSEETRVQPHFCNHSINS